jgi:hypothetical protein
MVNPNINSFAQTPVQGQMDLSFIGSVVSARVSANQATALIAGQAVAGDNATPSTAQDGVPPVLALTNGSVPALGFVVRNIKDINAPTNARIELAMEGACMYMTSDSTVVGITRFAPVEYNATANTVLAWQGINPIVGYAYDAAINAGDLIRVLIKSPQLSAASQGGGVKNAIFTVTQAQVNAGLTLIPAVAGQTIYVHDFNTRTTGSWATGTAVVLEDTAGSPVLAATLAQADLGNVLFPGATGVTLGAGYGGVGLTAGKGLQIAGTGSAFTGGTAIIVDLTYSQASAV